jgi:hypothetical protein
MATPPDRSAGMRDAMWGAMFWIEVFTAMLVSVTTGAALVRASAGPDREFRR